MKAIGSETAVYLWQDAMDMRMSFDRLAGFVAEHLQRSVIAGGIYVFFSRCRSRVKILYWDRDGYALWHKRLEAGTYKVERIDGHEQITAVDLEELLGGTELSRIKIRKQAEKGSFNSVPCVTQNV
jgi:transposase